MQLTVTYSTISPQKEGYVITPFPIFMKFSSVTDNDIGMNPLNFGHDPDDDPDDDPDVRSGRNTFEETEMRIPWDGMEQWNFEMSWKSLGTTSINFLSHCSWKYAFS